MAALKRLCLQRDVEQGEEAREIEDGADDDESPSVDSSATTSATVLSITSAVQPCPVPTIPIPDRETQVAHPDNNWEVVTDEVHLPSVDMDSRPNLHVGDTTWTGSLSKLWWTPFSRRGPSPNPELNEHN